MNNGQDIDMAEYASPMITSKTGQIWELHSFMENVYIIQTTCP